MKNIGYFIIGVFTLIVDMVFYIINRGETVISNRKFYKQLDKNLKRD